MNRDGKPDAIVADAAGIEVLLGKGDGTFGAFSPYFAGSALNSPVIADFNSDGKPDVAAVNPTANSVSLFLGNGDGAFQSVRNIALPAGIVLQSVAAGDFNGDGKQDLMVTFAAVNFTSPGGLLVLLGNGDGTFQAPVTITLPGPLFNGPLALGDVNGDGKLDAITAINGNSNQVAVLLGNGNGTFQAPKLTSTNTAPPTITITELNGDGKLDLLLSDCCGLTEGSYLIGNGDGTFQPEVQFPSGPEPAGFAVADFNGDGKLDAAVIGRVTQSSYGTLAILFNTSGAAGTTATTTTANSVSVTFSPNAQTITLSAGVTSSGAPVTGGTVTFTLLGNTVTANVTNGTASASFTISAGTAAGTYPLQAVYNPSAGLAASSDTKQLTISKATPVVIWTMPADITVGTPLGPAQLNATANVPGSFVYTPPAGTVLPARNGQTLSVLFTPADTTDYNTQTASVLINVKPATGATVLTVAPATAVFSAATQTVTLSATLTSSLGTVTGGTVTFTIPAVGSVTAAVSGGIASAPLTIPANTPAGVYPIQASYGGAGQFTAAGDNSKTLTITKATPVITWANPADITVGTPVGPVQLNATASVPGSFTYTPAAGTLLPAGNGQTLFALFMPTDSADYTTATKSVSINVKPAVPGGLSITNYQLVSTQPAPGGNAFLTWRADLINPGGPLDSLTATLTSLDPFTIRVVLGQGVLIFKPVPANSQVTSLNTFTILTNPNVPLDPAKLLWTLQTTAATPVANPGPNQTVKLGSTVTLDATGSTNPSGIGTLTYNWMFISRPPGTRADLFYSSSPLATFTADAVGTFTLQLTVSNGVASSTANVTITVVP